MDEKHVCVFCRNTGKHGAEWLVRVKGEADRRVHKPCGEQAVATAPKGTEARLVPSPELRARWQKERDERAARAFWSEKFDQAVSRRAKGTTETPTSV